MRDAQFTFVVIDYKTAKYENEKFIFTILEKLRTQIYLNRSLLISKQTLLVKLNAGDLGYNMSNPKYHIENIIIELSDNGLFIGTDLDDINIYCFPIDLNNFENELAPFKKEIEYLKNKKI